MKIEKSELLKFYLIWNSPFEKFQDWFQEYIDTDGLRTHKEIKEIHQDFDLLEKILTDIGEPPFPENDVVVLSADECLLCDENNILHEIDVTAGILLASEQGMFLCDWQVKQLEKAGVHDEIIDYFMAGFEDADPKRRKL